VLPSHAGQVTIVARGESLAALMSQYLVDEIAATPNIDVLTSTHVAGAAGDGRRFTAL
jgi:thioredoxin reductase (NADPH)